MPYKDPYSEKARESHEKSVKRWLALHPNYHKEWRKRNPNYMSQYLKPYFKLRNPEIKARVMTHYGNGVSACVRCGFSDIRALSIDHINGGGYTHRKEIHRSGNTFNWWLISNNYPLGYQTLCMNCQWIKRFEQQKTTS